MVWNVPQRSIVDDDSITNNLYQSIEGCFAQQPRLPLFLVMVEGNESVILPSGQQFEHASLEKLNTTISHETVERTTFHKQMDRNAPTRNQNSGDAQASIEMTKGKMVRNEPTEKQNSADVKALVQMSKGQMDRNATIENQNSTDVQALVQMLEG